MASIASDVRRYPISYRFPSTVRCANPSFSSSVTKRCVVAFGNSTKAMSSLSVGGSSALAMISSIKSARSDTAVVVGVVIGETNLQVRRTTCPHPSEVDKFYLTAQLMRQDVSFNETNQGWDDIEHGRIRLCDRRRGIVGVRAGQPAERGRPAQGPAARGWSQGQLPLDPYPDRIWKNDVS